MFRTGTSLIKTMKHRAEVTRVRLLRKIAKWERRTGQQWALDKMKTMLAHLDEFVDICGALLSKGVK